MRFEVLGPLCVRTDYGEVPIRAGRERVLLAMLLLNAGSSVSVGRLVDALWPDKPPTSARNQVQACVSRLRKRLTSFGMSGDLVGTDPSGYRVRVDLVRIDLYEFRAKVEQARKEAAQGRQPQARDRFRAALALWRGPAMADIDSTDVRRIAVALDEERIQALEECIGVELTLDKGGELVGELTELVQQHPYREGLCVALMRALYRSGRSADALATYRRARNLFRDELGTEPGENLQQLHQAILNRDPSLASRAAPTVFTTPTPHELPAEATYFVGREREAKLLVTALTSTARQSRRRPPAVLLYGPGGVGKSALAVRVANDVAAAYPDGQLYVDLCGSTPGRQPLPAIDVLGRFLRRLGIPPDQIPSDETEAAALFRSVSAGRQLLFVLDNAASKDQVSPLMPGNPANGVVITSRHPLSSLDVGERFRVGVLANDDALTLLFSLADLAGADPQAAGAIVALSGGLPLAIRIAAGRLASRPDVSVTEYAQRLADRSRRLDELRLDDLAVRACIRTSYEALQSSDDPTEQLAARAFRMLGLLHVPDFAPGVVAAMLPGPTTYSAQASLDRLVDAQLLEPIPGGRYRLHDLVRLAATETTNRQDDQPTREEALRRAITYYSGAAVLAGNLLFPSRSWVFDPLPVPTDIVLPTFKEPPNAKAWIDDELLSLVAAVEQAFTTAVHTGQLALRLSEEAWDHLHHRSEWQAALRLSQCALHFGRNSDAATAGWGYLALGRTEANFGNYDVALTCLERALEIMRASDNNAGTVLALTALGVVANWRGEPLAALSYHAEAMDLARRRSVNAALTVLLINMSACYVSLSRLDEAAKAAEQCAAISRRDRNFKRLGDALHNLAVCNCLVGRLAEAMPCANEALAHARDVGNHLSFHEALITRSVIHLWQGNHTIARRDVHDVLNSARANGDRYAEAAALRLQAKILAAAGQLAEAAAVRTEAGAAYARLVSRRDPVIETLLAHDGPVGAQVLTVAPAR